MHASKNTKKEKGNKLALVLGGGGMSTSYIVGFLEGFKKKYRITPDIIIAGSGSAGTASYFVSGQFNTTMKNIWLKEILNPRFITGKGFFKKIDIDFLIDEVFKKKPKLDTEKLHNSPIVLAIPMIDANTGKLHYFTNKDQVDWFEVLRAGKAIPIFYDKSIRIGNHKYHDSHLSATPESHARYARKLGATHIISVHCVSESARLESEIIEGLWFLFKKTRNFRKNYFAISKIGELASSTHIALFCSRKPYANVLDTKKEDIEDTIALGYRDCLENNTLKHFIKTFLKNSDIL